MAAKDKRGSFLAFIFNLHLVLLQQFSCLALPKLFDFDSLDLEEVRGVRRASEDNVYLHLTYKDRETSPDAILELRLKRRSETNNTKEESLFVPGFSYQILMGNTSMGSINGSLSEQEIDAIERDTYTDPFTYSAVQVAKGIGNKLKVKFNKISTDPEKVYALYFFRLKELFKGKL